MSIKMISINGNQTSFNLSSIGISNSKSFLKQSSYSSSKLNYLNKKNNNFSKLHTLKTQHRSCRINAVAAGTAVETEPVYVNTTLYELLGISESGTLSEIKNAYRQLARKYHPDVSPPDRTEEYTQRFLQVQEAYETLSDPQTRASYDRDMARALFNGRKRGDRVGFVDRDEWQSQLEDLIRSSNINEEEDSQSWGARMRSKNRSSI